MPGRDQSNQESGCSGPQDDVHLYLAYSGDTDRGSIQRPADHSCMNFSGSISRSPPSSSRMVMRRRIVLQLYTTNSPCQPMTREMSPF